MTERSYLPIERFSAAFFCKRRLVDFVDRRTLFNELSSGYSHSTVSWQTVYRAFATDMGG
jgi:hypothetical protein